jgi:hypothetical protein
MISAKVEYSNAVNPMLADVLRNYEAMANSTASHTSDVYKKTISQFITRIMHDGDDRLNAPTAMRKAVRELTEQGISFVDYESGRTMRMDSAVRNALTTEYSNIVQEVQDKLGEEIGADAIEISAHSHSADDHEPIQGRIFTEEEFEKLQNGEPAREVDIDRYEAGETDYLGETFQIDRPIGMWNCRHLTFPFILGISLPSHSREELDRLKKQNEDGIKFLGKKYTLYEAEQKQRQLETEMRREREKLNLLKEVRDTDPRIESDYHKSRKRLAGLRDEYKALGAVLAPKAIRMKMERSYVPRGSAGKANTTPSPDINTSYVSGKNLINEYDRYKVQNNFELFSEIAEKQGFYGLPTKVTPKELDNYIKENNAPLLWRGDNDSVTKDMKGQIELFLNGHPPHISGEGGSWYGRGIYSTNIKETAKGYANKGGLERQIYKLTLNKNAKVLDLTEGDSLNKFVTKWGNTTAINESNTISNAAAAMGYDAIKIPIHGNEFYYNILNRSAIITDGRNYYE